MHLLGDVFPTSQSFGIAGLAKCFGMPFAHWRQLSSKVLSVYVDCHSVSKVLSLRQQQPTEAMAFADLASCW
jgi:hypothetical protein